MPVVAFPECDPDHLRVPAELAARSLDLRPAVAGDLPFLRRLYGQVRAAELAIAAWPEQAMERFLDSQFALQHAHYLGHFAGADFLVLERDGEPAGRLYLWRRPPTFHIVDISLVDALQGQGVGRCLLAAVQQRAAVQDCSVQLHVDARNERARRLYETLGFSVQALQGAHLLMRWRAPAFS